jgi:hypothetical protein
LASGFGEDWLHTLTGGEEMDDAMGVSLISHTANIMLKMKDFRLWENGNPILLVFAFFWLAKICGLGGYCDKT